MKSKIIWFISSILFALSINSCSTRSKFSSESLSIGMTKEQVLAKFGKPYKSSFVQDKETGAIEEALFYREFLYISGNSNITNILTFKDGKLISLKQGQESSSSTQTTIINTPGSTVVQTPN
ncbi:hypothetical protein BB021_18535 [Elizabethkingia ursingii]|uniref:DUF2845 domain-containing protein n=2 Tax=Elizabethkingia ursingii TaxID=1756150 RepID=A0ABX3NEY3_9FLAO|nr:hypothetical protein BB021_18535 [Elizabethkingia ursingii]